MASRAQPQHAGDGSPAQHAPAPPPRPAAPPEPRPRSYAVPLLCVLAAVVLGVVAVRLHYWRRGTELVGAAILLAAVLRVVLPEHRVGLLAARSRAYDTAVLGGLGVGVVVLGAVVPYVPPLTVP